MTHINTRQQLITWLEDNSPTPSTLRAVRDGQVELLGLFDPIPSSSNPGWIVRVTSAITGREWYVVISMRKFKKPTYYAWVVGEVPWRSWQGYRTENPLHYGDDRERCQKLYEKSL